MTGSESEKIEETVPIINGSINDEIPPSAESTALNSGRNLQNDLSEMVSENPDINLEVELAEMKVLQARLKKLVEGPISDKSELYHVEKIKEKFKEQFDGYDVVPIDDGETNMGYALINSELTQVENDWVLTDLDDTMIGTQEVKTQREDLIAEYFAEKGISLEREELKKMIKETDRFARWKDIQGGPEECYHPVAHMIALQLCIDALANLGENAKDFSKRDSTIGGVLDKISRIKSQLDTNSERVPGDPFRFNEKKQFIVTKFPPWSPELEEIFKKTMVAPPRYKNNVDAFDGNLKSGAIDEVNTGVFTSGVPSYQLQKLGELMKENPMLDFNSILLTRVGKDIFLKKFIEKIGIQNSNIVMYDDSISNLDKLVAMGEKDQDRTGNRIVGIVAHTTHSKDNGKESMHRSFRHTDVDAKTVQQGFEEARKARDSIL